MQRLSLNESLINILKDFPNLTVKEIQKKLIKQKVVVPDESINSLLYGELRERVNRDLNVNGIPTQSIKGLSFHASKGLEFKLYQRLIDKEIITTENSTIDYILENKKRGLTYHLDIAIELQNQKFNIEVDGFDHLRADARLSIQKQIRFKGMNAKIEIDWMDNKSSFVDFKQIDNDLIYKWCHNNLDWCRLYHEELIWPDDINRNMFLIESGWKIMRLWNEEVKRNINYCIQEIEDFLYR